MASCAPLEQRSALNQALAMDPLPRPLTFFLLLFSGTANPHRQAVIERRTQSSAITYQQIC
jgi:hypothetical protein